MASVIREKYHARFMPDLFKTHCPCCKKQWTLKTVDFHGHRTSIECANKCFSFSSVQPRSDRNMHEAWRQLWDNFVNYFGIQYALKLVSVQLHDALMLCRPVTPSVLETLVGKFNEASKHTATNNGMTPALFRAKRLNGDFHYGINFQPLGTDPGSTFHYDHGVGINQNTDATVLCLVQ
ncbi:hypothetical protein [Reinekea sp. G2M2-21]|uniref:hypothetical protein n=1 Tax=Reinekea sp. G2M2-21 TaxID=2788942 RepID=UPI0018A9DBE0|nr:hypothetical protein [Reinekea sp. G2M2-21]